MCNLSKQCICCWPPGSQSLYSTCRVLVGLFVCREPHSIPFSVPGRILVRCGDKWCPSPLWLQCYVMQVCVSNINPFNPSQGGVGRLLYSASNCKSGNHPYDVQNGDYCSRIISKYCGGSPSAFQQANNGWVCTDIGLYLGQKVCVLSKP